MRISFFVLANFCSNFARKFERLFAMFSKIRASFRDVLSVILLRQRAKTRSIFETRAKIHYQKRNFACSARNIAVQCAGIECIEGPFRKQPRLLKDAFKILCKKITPFYSQNSLH